MSFKKFESKRNLARKRRRAQRIWLFLTLGGVILVGLAFFILRGSQNSQPVAAIEVHGTASLKVDKEQVNLGDVQLGQTVKVSFQLTNVGDQPLRFSADPYVEVVEGC
jgi:cell division septal protein FtsQ